MSASPAYDRLPNSMRSIGESRYVRLDDPVILTYHCGATLPEPRQHVWDFRELQWWSRIFEYQWLKDVVDTFLAPGLEMKTVLDVGCGLEHPSCFMLAELGFGRVVAQDIWERHELIERIHLPNLEYCRMDINEAVPCQADLVCCLSVLEHMDPQQQARALRSLCDAVKPGGLLLLTFDMPGFEWDTDLDMYRHILRQREFDFIEIEVPEGQRVTSRNGPVPYAGWESLGRLELECYRLLTWHTGFRVSPKFLQREYTGQRKASKMAPSSTRRKGERRHGAKELSDSDRHQRVAASASQSQLCRDRRRDAYTDDAMRSPPAARCSKGE